MPRIVCWILDSTPSIRRNIIREQTKEKRGMNISNLSVACLVDEAKETRVIFWLFSCKSACCADWERAFVVPCDQGLRTNCVFDLIRTSFEAVF